MPIIAALVGIVLGAIAAIAYMRTAKQGSLHEADEKIQSAHAQAESLIGDAKRQAETLKKEALLEAKEEIIKNKQAAEAEDKQRKSEIRTLENRVIAARRNRSIVATMRSISASISCPARPVRSRSALASLRSSAPGRPQSSSVLPTLRVRMLTRSCSTRSVVRLPTRRPPSSASPSSRSAPSAIRPPRRFSPWRFSVAPPTIPPRSPSLPFIFPPMTSRVALSVARVATSAPLSRCRRQPRD
mgnify:CR=1 FL=1